MKVRIKFRKYGVMRFIGHLDMMRYFQKAMRRADIDICYSEGFSPHQIMSFAAPLGVGITSDGEYLDIEVHSSKSSAECIKTLNETMVPGVEISGYVKLPDNAKTAMSIVAAADYELSYKEDYQPTHTKSEWEKILEEEFFTKPDFIITKKTKKSEKEIDLKPLVYKLEVQGTEAMPKFHIMLSTGSTDNIKPELLLSSIYEKAKIPYDANAIQIHRNDVYANVGQEEKKDFKALLDMGEEIR